MANTAQDVLDLMNYTRGQDTNPEQEYVTIWGKWARHHALLDVTGSSWSFALRMRPVHQVNFSIKYEKNQEILDEAGGYTHMAAIIHESNKTLYVTIHSQ